MMTKMLARAMLAACTLALAALSTNSADAAYHRRHVTAHHFGRYLAYRHFHYHHRHYQAAPRQIARFGRSSGGRPSCFWTARAMGGPCGCWAEWKLLGLTQHVWNGVNMWLANDWLRFEHVAAAPNTAVVYPHRHVAPVKEVKVVDGRTMALLEDSWKTHWVSTSGLTFVRPPSSGKHRRPVTEAGPTGPRELAFALMPQGSAD